MFVADLVFKSGHNYQDMQFSLKPPSVGFIMSDRHVDSRTTSLGESSRRAYPKGNQPTAVLISLKFVCELYWFTSWLNQAEEPIPKGTNRPQRSPALKLCVNYICSLPVLIKAKSSSQSQPSERSGHRI